MRACIVRPLSPFHRFLFASLMYLTQGRPFSWQEAHIALAVVIQKFDITMHDPSYTLELKQALTLKPKGFFVHAIPRNRSKAPITVAPTSTLVSAPQVSKGWRGSSDSERTEGAEVKDGEKGEARQRLYVAYGSNTGTSQTFAQRIASDASAHGVFFLNFEP